MDVCKAILFHEDVAKIGIIYGITIFSLYYFAFLLLCHVYVPQSCSIGWHTWPRIVRTKCRQASYNRIDIMSGSVLTKARPFGASLHQVMLRVRDPAKSVQFYKDHFGMSLIDVKHFPDMKFSLYFLASLPDGEVHPEPGTPESNRYLWTFPRTVLELTHNHGTESDPDFAGYHNGNKDPRGFGHVGFIVDNIEQFCAQLESKDVKFQKRLTDGRMKTIAFALDPDGYWIEVVPRKNSQHPARSAFGPEVLSKPSLQQIMFRIKDPKVSVPWYEKTFGLTLVSVKHFPEAEFSLYFLGTVPEGVELPDPNSDEAGLLAGSLSTTLLELTHNHGTESDPNFAGYHSGNTDPRGFGHIGFLLGGDASHDSFNPDGDKDVSDESKVQTLERACELMEQNGVQFSKRPHEGKMRGIAFVKDPDGYSIELIQRGVKM